MRIANTKPNTRLDNAKPQWVSAKPCIPFMSLGLNYLAISILSPNSNQHLAFLALMDQYINY
jgi:hypothetical protein